MLFHRSIISNYVNHSNQMSLHEKIFTDGGYVVVVVTLSINLRDYSIGPGAYIIKLSLPGLNVKSMIFPVFIYH